MSITDPMHTILLGLVHNEAKLCLSSLPNAKLSQFYSRIQRVKVPYDIGRIPSNNNGKTDLTSLTADQWKNFALIYARPCLSGFLSTNAYTFSVKLLNSLPSQYIILKTSLLCYLFVHFHFTLITNIYIISNDHAQNNPLTLKQVRCCGVV